jgi:HAD superfamily hydrolase (TIGR01484 family)
MNFVALATDYDGTLAEDGVVAPQTLEALERFKKAGNRLILVTGRELPDLRCAFDRLDLFDAVVAENGAVLLLPGTGEERKLAPSPPPALVDALRARKVEPLSVGRSIVATWEPNEGIVLDVVHKLGLELQVIFNKGAVMCLPPGINKASGLEATLGALRLSALNVVGIGDAENDQAFLSARGCAVAVANALDGVKANADIITRAPRGAGVTELIDRWLDDSEQLFGNVRRHDVYLGEDSTGAAVRLTPDGGAVLIAGSSGIGKSHLATLLVERLIDDANQVLVVDPEGDYDNLENLAHLGDADRAPSADEALSLLAAPGQSLALNLLGVEVPDRPAFFARLMGELTALRAETGRPHWLVLDETHHLAPAGADSQGVGLPAVFTGLVLLTTSPNVIHGAVLHGVGQVVAVGDAAFSIIARVGAQPDEPKAPGKDEVLFWRLDGGMPPRRVAVDQPRQQHQRHTRKYATGQLGPDKSFYFRGPGETLNLRANNLTSFLDLARGVDDATWLHHLSRGDCARWFREDLCDEAMAQEIDALKGQVDAAATRSAVTEIVKRRYAIGEPG